MFQLITNSLKMSNGDAKELVPGIAFLCFASIQGILKGWEWKGFLLNSPTWREQTEQVIFWRSDSVRLYIRIPTMFHCSGNLDITAIGRI
ncbi:hypothetical protein DX130_00705 [Paenibacillus paeoniae]|uniref:Uncharacterized protein n=1 Tax=Paenibacillus paeoniae TaxID=2292705 RepID=A0A371PHD5_9BACL|nr:hypothetical protein DX130_00705 [Paenibacillus paeoniae]